MDLATLFEQSRKTGPISRGGSCEPSIALHVPRNLQFHFRYSWEGPPPLSANYVTEATKYAAWGWNSIGWSHDHGKILCNALFFRLVSTNVYNVCLYLCEDREMSSSPASASSNIIFWKKSRCFLAVFEIDFITAQCEHLNSMWLMCSQEPQRLAGTVFWLCWKSVAGLL